MRMIPAGTLDEALSEIDIKSDGYILPYGAMFLPTEKRWLV